MIFKKIQKKKTTIDLNEDVILDDSNVTKSMRIDYGDHQIEEKPKKYIRIQTPEYVAPITNNYTNDYLKDLHDEIKLNNLIIQKGLLQQDQQQQINIIDIDDDDDDDDIQLQQQYENARQRRSDIRDQSSYINLETDDNLITDMDKQRMPMIEIQSIQQKHFYIDNSDDEEFNRFENSLIKANNIHIEQEPNYKKFKFNDSKFEEIAIENIQNINIQTILQQLQQTIQKETNKRDKLQIEFQRSTEAIESSEVFIKTWREQVQQLHSELCQLELVNEFFYNLNDMFKEKAQLFLRKLDEFEEIVVEYREQVIHKIHRNIQYSELFDQIILMEYAKELHRLMNDVDEEYLDINIINQQYVDVMYLSPNPQILQKIFDYQLILRFCDQYLQNMQSNSVDIFEDLIQDKTLLSQMILGSKVVEFIILLNPTIPPVITYFLKCCVKHTYTYYKSIDHPDKDLSLTKIQKYFQKLLKSLVIMKDNEHWIGNIKQLEGLLPHSDIQKLLN